VAHSSKFLPNCKNAGCHSLSGSQKSKVYFSSFPLVVTIDLAIILINYSHSSKRFSTCASVIISDLINSLNQYLVSFASFRAIDYLLMKSLSLSAERYSSILAPIE
jgi:hypothetical protein